MQVDPRTGFCVNNEAFYNVCINGGQTSGCVYMYTPLFIGRLVPVKTARDSGTQSQLSAAIATFRLATLYYVITYYIPVPLTYTASSETSDASAFQHLSGDWRSAPCCACFALRRLAGSAVAVPLRPGPHGPQPHKEDLRRPLSLQATEPSENRDPAPGRRWLEASWPV